MSSAPALTKSVVFNHSVSQVQTWLQNEYQRWSNKPLITRMVSNPTNLRQLQPELEQPDGSTDQLRYPFLLLSMGDISLDMERMGARKNHASKGFVVERDLDNRLARMENLRPVNVALGLSFRSDSLEDVLDFAHVLLMEYPVVRLALKLNDTFRVYNQLRLPENVSAPPMGDEGAGDNYSFETIVILRTYIGNSFEHPLVSQIKFERYGEPSGADPFFANNETVELVDFTDYYNREHPAYNSTYKGDR